MQFCKAQLEKLKEFDYVSYISINNSELQCYIAAYTYCKLQELDIPTELLQDIQHHEFE